MATDLTEQSKFQWLARFGFLVRGLLYIVIAALVIATGRTEDLTGVMAYLNHGVGRGLTVLLVAGMTGHGLWRLCDAAFGMESGRHHARAWRKRTAAGFSGAIYLYLAYKALRILFQAAADSGDAHKHVAEALHLPAGTLVLAIAAAVLFGAGLVQLWQSWGCRFLDDLGEDAHRPTAKWLGRFGYAARGVIFLTVGYLLARAAYYDSAANAGGLEQALDALRGPLQYPVAFGLMLFGTYSIIEARYRPIHKPPTGHIKRKVEEAIAT